MAKIVLVTGGARSGKSRYAQQLAESLSPSRIYVATSPVIDEEMEQRIQRHRQDREGRNWHTVEEQIDLEAVLKRYTEYTVILIDCLTLYVNNLMYQAEQTPSDPIDEDRLAKCCEQLIQAARNRSGTVIFVSNEVGMGIVPEKCISRKYRDLIGRCNQVIAQNADSVTLIVSGIPLQVK